MSFGDGQRQNSFFFIARSAYFCLLAFCQTGALQTFLKMSADATPHFACLRRLGLADDGFQQMRGEWTDHFDVDEPDIDLHSSGGSSGGSSVSGSGHFGDVVLVRYQNRPFALKLFKNPLSKADRERIAYVLYLYRTKRREWPATLVRYVAGFHFDQSGADVREAVLMERVDGISFERMIADNRFANNREQVACWLRDTLHAVEFLHRHGVAHRDVHEGNVMVSRDGRRATLIDLDLACGAALASERCTALCYDKASPRSTPPDLWCAAALQERQVPAAQWFAGDIWGIGCAFAALLMHQVGFIPTKLSYGERDAASCTSAFGQPARLQKTLAPHLQTLAQQFFDNKALESVLLRALLIDWTKRPSARSALRALPDCRGHRAQFTLPPSSAEFEAAVARGEIELTGSYL